MITDLPFERVLPYLNVVTSLSEKYKFNPDLVLAIIFQESGGLVNSARVEKGLSLTWMPNTFKAKLSISYDTECLFQNTSWGLMHIMGFKARELEYEGPLQVISFSPEMGIEWGLKALESCRQRFGYEKDYIAAYNGGPGAVLKKTKGGVYPNQKYVDEVVEKWAFIESKKLWGINVNP